MLLLGGISTPVGSMPCRGQLGAYANPLRYFCTAVGVLYPKASSPASQRQEMIAHPALA
ncbi:MAG: hypothetical protein HG428_000540 [Bacteroidia bacterium]|nr:hypothetical protein [Bacteroidia bacterium]